MIKEKVNRFALTSGRSILCSVTSGAGIGGRSAMLWMMITSKGCAFDRIPQWVDYLKGWLGAHKHRDCVTVLLKLFILPTSPTRLFLQVWEFTHTLRLVAQRIKKQQCRRDDYPKRMCNLKTYQSEIGLGT